VKQRRTIKKLSKKKVFIYQQYMKIIAKI
jgi:hypothetical protein